MAKAYQVVVVGARAVGREMVRVLRQRRFPLAGLRVLAIHARQIQVDGQSYQVEEVSEEAFQGADIALFAGRDKREGHFGWAAARQGAVVIDNGAAYRLYPNVPLVVPEVNPEALRQHEGLIASPNCSTIQLVVALKSLHDAARIKRVVVSTYQAVSGRGASEKGTEPVNQLFAEMRSLVERLDGSAPQQEAPDERMQRLLELAPLGAEEAVTDRTLFPHPIAANLLPHIDSFAEAGYTREELKLVRETRKLMGDENMQITATAVRVPVFNAHSESVNVEFHQPLSAAEARRLLEQAPGIKVVDDPAGARYPMPLEVSGTDEVFVGRIREDRTVPHGLNLWVVADNLRKGAALNAVQVAEKMIEMGLLRPRSQSGVAVS